MHLNRFKSSASRKLRFLAVLFLLGVLSGCQKMESSEHGVVFSRLPTGFPFYGGVRDRPIRPGEAEYLFPWQDVYRLKTSMQTIGWGSAGVGELTEANYVETRALDGNEVGLSMTVQYRLDPDRVSYIIQRVGIDDSSIRRLVSSLARADIRTHMNTLSTSGFFNPEQRQHAVDRVRAALDVRLRPEGIIIESVQYNDHRFERKLQDGSTDRSYQEQIDLTQAKNQETEQEQKKIRTVVEQKNKELNEAQARVNRILEEADGFKRQAILRGDSYLQTKRNQAEQVAAVGNAEVEGLKKQVQALSGPGGRALLRLSVVQALTAARPRFVVLNSSSDGKNGIDVNRTDTNELLRQAGIFSGLLDTRADRRNATPVDVSDIYQPTPTESAKTNQSKRNTAPERNN